MLVPDLLARVTVQTCRQSGLSVVYQELLDYGGDEIYFKNEPAITGKTFGEVLGLYPTLDHRPAPRGRRDPAQPRHGRGGSGRAGPGDAISADD